MSAKPLPALLGLALAAAPSAQPAPAEQRAHWVATCKDWDGWDKPAPPFKVFGNTYYVGTCGISAVLIATDAGEVVIDAGPANAGGLVARNIETLGFRLASVKLLLNTHEHHDHAGGLAVLHRLTGAPVLVSPAAAAALRAGTAGPGDPQFADHHPFPTVAVQRALGAGEVLSLGTLRLKSYATPGHTPGATSWLWRACEGAVCRTIVYADSLTPVSSGTYRFTDHRAYVAAFRKSLALVASLDCDILLSPHPSASGMRDRLAKGHLVNPLGCKAYAAGLGKQLDERLAKEAHGG